MSRDIHLLDKETGDVYSFDAIKTQGWLDGHRGGLEQCAGWLKEKAVRLFRDSKDNQALELRRLAEAMVADLDKAMLARAAQHEKDFPMLVKKGPPT